MNLWLALFVSCALALLAAQPSYAQVRFGGSEAGGATGFAVTSYRDIPFRTVVRQQYDYSCGSAALATLLTYHYGQRSTESDIFKAMFATGDQEKIRKAGFSLLDMKAYLDARGMMADGFRLPWAKLVELNTPAIALVTTERYKHFVVIKGVTQAEVLVGDPALGLKRYKRAEFEKMWGGIVLLVREARTEAVFNSKDEWSPYHPTPWNVAYTTSALATGLSTELPLYQIAPVFNLDTLR
jgi:predicted double-glycine peptidase